MRTLAEGLFSVSDLNSSSELDSSQISIHPAPFTAKTQRDSKHPTVLIVGTRDLFRAAIRALLESVRQVEVVGETQSDLETFDLVERLRPSVLLIDEWVKPDLLQPLRILAPEMRIVVLGDGDR